MWQQILPAFRITLVLTVLTGLIYPAVVTGLCQVLFPFRANGSLIPGKGPFIGSELIGQSFARPEYFHSRPSAAGDGYDATASGGSNLGPTSKKLVDRVKADVQAFAKSDPGATTPLPADLLTTSASGLDPHISPASAAVQVARVARARNIQTADIQSLILAQTQGRTLGFMGEPRVNVLALNIALDKMDLDRKQGAR
jgi:potassium-transporting ATPase KdpC subunit